MPKKDCKSVKRYNTFSSSADAYNSATSLRAASSNTTSGSSPPRCDVQSALERPTLEADFPQLVKVLCVPLSPLANDAEVFEPLFLHLDVRVRHREQRVLHVLVLDLTRKLTQA